MLKTMLKKSRLLLPAFLFVSVVTAQGTCSELLERALEEVDQSCTDLGRNEACYGYNRVEASFIVDVEDEFFSKPADKTGVADLATIRTAPLDVDNDQWGVAVMSLQANLPNTIPGQSVTFILLGDTEVENAVSPESAFVPANGMDVTVTTAQGANIRSGPGTNFNVVGGVSASGTLQADGLSVDGAWLRVAYRDRPAWISRSVIADDPAIADLPTLTEELRTPMQAFYLRTGIGQPTCEEAPDDVLLVQGPEGIEIELTVNGANIQLGSSGALRTVEIDGQLYLEIIVFDGKFEVDGRIITPGYRSLICLGNEDSRGLDGQANDLVATCGASEPERVEPDIFGDEWCIMEEIPGDLLNYPLEILCPGETPPPPPVQQPQQAGSQSQNPDVDCSTFQRIGPDSVAATDVTFSWTEAPGAAEYEIVFYNYEDAVAGTFRTTGTNITLNVGTIPTGGELSWEVRAYGPNNSYACVTARSAKAARQSDPNAPQGGSSQGDKQFSATWGCDANGNVVVNYSNVPEEATVLLLQFVDRSETFHAKNYTSFSRPNGTLVYTAFASTSQSNGSLTVGPGGQSISLPGTLTCNNG
jgi:hypothetical protein